LTVVSRRPTKSAGEFADAMMEGLKMEAAREAAISSVATSEAATRTGIAPARDGNITVSALADLYMRQYARRLRLCRALRSVAAHRRRIRA
jgi:hypothetical protein